ncbi:hypothetical protein ACOSP7_031197 [Xanthoceras sorbifolium]
MSYHRRCRAVKDRTRVQKLVHLIEGSLNSRVTLGEKIAAIKAYLKGNAVELDAHAQDTGAVADLPIGSTDLTVPSTPVMELQNEDSGWTKETWTERESWNQWPWTATASGEKGAHAAALGGVLDKDGKGLEWLDQELGTTVSWQTWTSTLGRR